MVKRYTLQLDEDTRDEWKDVVDDSNQYGTISQLIRSAVDEKIKRLEDESEGELSREEQNIVDKIKAENMRVLDKLEAIEELGEEIKDSQLTTLEAEDMIHQQSQTLLREFEGDNE